MSAPTVIWSAWDESAWDDDPEIRDIPIVDREETPVDIPAGCEAPGEAVSATIVRKHVLGADDRPTCDGDVYVVEIHEPASLAGVYTIGVSVVVETYPLGEAPANG